MKLLAFLLVAASGCVSVPARQFKDCQKACSIMHHSEVVRVGKNIFQYPCCECEGGEKVYLCKPDDDGKCE